MSTVHSSTKKSKNEKDNLMDTDDAVKCFSSNTKTIVRFFTGAYEGKFGYVDPTRHAQGGKVPVCVTMRTGVVKKTKVSIWSIADPHPQKPKTFAVAAVMQFPSFEKELKAFAKKCVKLGFTKNEVRYNSLMDLIYEEVEIAKKKNRSIQVEYND